MDFLLLKSAWTEHAPEVAGCSITPTSDRQIPISRVKDGAIFERVVRLHHHRLVGDGAVDTNTVARVLGEVLRKLVDGKKLDRDTILGMSRNVGIELTESGWHADIFLVVVVVGEDVAPFEGKTVSHVVDGQLAAAVLKIG